MASSDRFEKLGQDWMCWQHHLDMVKAAAEERDRLARVAAAALREGDRATARTVWAELEKVIAEHADQVERAKHAHGALAAGLASCIAAGHTAEDALLAPYSWQSDANTGDHNEVEIAIWYAENAPAASPSGQLPRRANGVRSAAQSVSSISPGG